MEEYMKKLIGILIISILFLSACHKGNGAELSAGEYHIYYIDSKTSGIVSESYVPVEHNKEQLVGELLSVLRSEPKNMVYKKAIPDTVTVREYTFSNDQLVINFDTNYSELTGIAEVLCRATIVKTVCQIPGIEFVLFNVNGQPLIDSNGVQIGLMTDEFFIENTEAETNYKVTLYFANEAGDKLVESDTNIYYTGTGSIEELVIKQLINGSTEVGLYDTIPEGTTLLNVSTKEGICYVDFNEKFLEKLPGISDEVAIFSVVNSLAELPNINKVQFFINGQITETYREGTPFSGPFERNLTISEESE